MTGIKNNIDQFEKLAANPNQEPFVMLNLLKLKEDGGSATYLRYAREAARFVEGVGGEVRYLGRANELLNGEENWDIVMLVQYPSRQAFLRMANDPDYLEVHKLRKAALERAVLYATDPVTFGELKK